LLLRLSCFVLQPEHPRQLLQQDGLGGQLRRCGFSAGCSVAPFDPVGEGPEWFGQLEQHRQERGEIPEGTGQLDDDEL